MKTSFRRAAVGAAGLAAAAIGLTPLAAHASTSSPATTPSTSGIVSYPISFQVVNTDQATVIKDTPGDGKTYTVEGHLTAPAGALGAGNTNKAVTLYTHGLGYGEWFWNFQSVPGYSYADAAATAGLTSVTIDSLGYGASGLPPGEETGYGTEATVDHEIIQDLKDGHYTLGGASPVSFSKVGLAAGTQGVFSEELETYTWHDASDIVMANFADEGFSPSLLTAYAVNVADCLTTPLPQGGAGTPSGYQYRETSAAQFTQADLNDTSPAVQAAAVQLHSKDPCGYPAFSVEPTLAENNLLTASITEPILSVFGSDDNDFIMPVTPAYQKVEFALNHDATVDTIQGAGQDITIGNQHTAFDTTVTSWLLKHGYGMS